MKRLQYLILLFLVLLSYFLFHQKGFTPLINELSFFPDTKFTIDADKLPPNVEEIFISTDDDLQIHSYFLPNKSSSKLVIFFHGNAGNLGHRLTDLLQLNFLGVNVLGVEYRGYGKSQGQASEKGIYLDGQAAYNYSINELGFQAKDVVLFGRSIGTTVAVHTAQNKNVAGLILASPLTSAKEHAKFSRLGLLSFLAGKAFDNYRKIDNVQCPLLVIHGNRDTVIPFEMGRELFDKAKGKKQFFEIQDANHNNLSDTYANQYWPAIKDFLDTIAK